MRVLVTQDMMDERLRKLIGDYLAAVSAAVELLQRAGIPMPGSDTAWSVNGLSNKGLLPGGIKYFKHGYGCAVHLKAGVVDFDFGKDGQTNGFNFSRLAGFAEGKLEQYGFSSEDDLKECFRRAVEEEHVRYSGYILYYFSGPN